LAAVNFTAKGLVSLLGAWVMGKPMTKPVRSLKA
jgi:hypothetical protein